MAGLVAGCVLAALPSPASARFFESLLGGGSDDRAAGFIPSIPFFGQPRTRPRAQARPAQVAQADYSRPPPPPKADKNASDVKNIVVIGDSMADWLASGLEEAFADAPEISVIRKARPLSSLIYNPGSHDPTTRVDWPAAARDILAKEPASFIVMTIGLADRDPIRVPASARPADAPSNNKPVKPAENRNVAETATDQSAAGPSAPSASYDFKTEKWAELYGKRIDKTIAGLRSKGVPVF
jgi:uncharacterized protein